MFYLGMRVKLSDIAAQSGRSRHGIPRGQSLTGTIGTVEGHSNGGNMASVLWDGANTPAWVAILNLKDARR